MPEGDILVRTAGRLQRALVGQPLLDAELRWPDLSTARLDGQVIEEILPHGKHLLMRFDQGWTLHSHLRMDGEWYVQATTVGAPVNRVPLSIRGRQVRVVLRGRHWTALGLQLGMLDLIPTSAEHTVIGHLGPDILAEELDTARAVANVAGAETTIGAALLDQQLVCGIGTIWSSESLFAERINPWRPATGITLEAIERLLLRARRLMQASLGSPVPTATGDQRAGHRTWVHGRAGRGCRRCGGTVRVSSIAEAPKGRPMFFCPVCQAEPTRGHIRLDLATRPG